MNSHLLNLARITGIDLFLKWSIDGVFFPIMANSDIWAKFVSPLLVSSFSITSPDWFFSMFSLTFRKELYHCHIKSLSREGLRKEALFWKWPISSATLACTVPALMPAVICVDFRSPSLSLSFNVLYRLTVFCRVSQHQRGKSANSN